MKKQNSFPGYEYSMGKSTYMGEEVGEGGYVYQEEGIHRNVALLDVASMHPSSIEAMEMFGPYTEKFSEIKNARITVKHAMGALIRGDEEAYERYIQEAEKVLDGGLKPFLEKDVDALDSLSYSLKIVINSVYGLTSAKFPNRFLDTRNVDNIVAKRGALFMIDLKHYVQEQGFNVAHIKTDSIKIPEADADIIRLVEAFGAEYEYEFEHEATYQVMCLVNKAVYIAEVIGQNGKPNYWSATGAMFQHPYVFTILFGDGSYELEDLVEPKSVAKGHIYIDPVEREQPPMTTMKDEDGEDMDTPDLNELHFIGRTSKFYPVKAGRKGGRLWRIHDGKHYAVAGTSGHYWREAHLVKSLDDLDMSYYEALVGQALEAINKVGSYDELIESSTMPKPFHYVTQSRIIDNV